MTDRFKPSIVGRWKAPGVRCVLVVCCALLSAGCASGLLRGLGNSIPTATADNPVVRILCVWQPAEGRGLDDLPARGFAGKVFFFTRNGAGPVRVDDDVRIYVFDDEGTREQQVEPFHKFDFVGGAWNAFLTDTQLGPAYNLFVPYSRKGYQAAHCALRLRLKPQAGGPTIQSDMATVILPGTAKKEDATAVAAREAASDDANSQAARPPARAADTENNTATTHADDQIHPVAAANQTYRLGGSDTKRRQLQQIRAALQQEFSAVQHADHQYSDGGNRQAIQTLSHVAGTEAIRRSPKDELKTALEAASPRTAPRRFQLAQPAAATPLVNAEPAANPLPKTAQEPPRPPSNAASPPLLW